jgi:hypothetical protein
MAGGAVDQSLLDLLPQIHALFSDPFRVVSDGTDPRSVFSSPSRGAWLCCSVDSYGWGLDIVDSVGFVAHFGVVRTRSLVSVVVISDDFVDFFLLCSCGLVWVPLPDSVGK